MLRVTVHKLLTRPLGRLLVVVALIGMMPLTVKAGAFALKTLHRPGPVSDTAEHAMPINGFGSHAEFEKECSHCHAPLHCITANRCQECHLDIAKQRADAVGLHGVLPGTARCQTCHIEHQGRDAVISDVPLANIDHGKLTGFSLALHAEDYSGEALVCDDCHVDHVFASEGVDCIACHAAHDSDFTADHRDEHGDSCLECHDGRDRMRDFDHDQAYALGGGHADVSCQECHADKKYVGTERDCSGCHEEPALHVGQFGLQCSRCHTADAWAPAQFRQHDFLAALGPEGDLRCETCHVDTYNHYPCESCHGLGEMESLHIERAVAGEVDDCIGCHPQGPGKVHAAPPAGDAPEVAQPEDQGNTTQGHPQGAPSPQGDQGADQPGNADPGPTPQGGTGGAGK